MRQTLPAEHHGYADISRLGPSSEAYTAVVRAHIQDCVGRLLEQDDGRQANMARAHDYDFDAHKWERGLKLTIAVDSMPLKRWLAAEGLGRRGGRQRQSWIDFASVSLVKTTLCRHLCAKVKCLYDPLTYFKTSSSLMS